MFDYSKFESSKEQVEAFVNYWQALKRSPNDVAPYWDDFSFGHIHGIKDYVFISEFISVAEVRVRHSGAALTHIISHDLTGQNVFQFIPPGGKRAERSYYFNLVKYPCAGVISRVGHHLKDQPFVYRNTHLPFLDADGKARFFAGVGSETKKIAAEPAFTLAELNNKALLEYYFIDIGAGVPTPHFVKEVKADWLGDDLTYSSRSEAAW